MTDILSYLNSKDVKEYLIHTGYPPDTAECAYIVWNCTKPLQEKHEAWKEILRTMPDMPVRYQNWDREFGTIHRLIEKVLAAEEELLGILQEPDPDTVYEYYYRCGRDVPYTRYAYPNDYVGTYDEMMEEFEGDDLDEMVIRKNYLNPNTSDLLHVDGIFDRQGQLNRIGAAARNDAEESENVYLLNWGFPGMWVDIPTPFERGDIVTGCRDGRGSGRPFVLTSTVSWHRREHNVTRTTLDKTDMDTSGLYFDEETGISDYTGPSMLDLEYCRETDYPGETALKACSLYLKGKIGLPWLLAAQGFSLAKSRQERLSWVRGNLDEVAQ